MKPILFNGDMVRAILEGRKTVTRRVVKPQPPKEAYAVYDFDEEEHTFDLICGKRFNGSIVDYAYTVKPPYWPGDTLYVREAFCNEMAAIRAEDKKSDPQYVFTREKVDARLKQICGDKFDPWEVRYGETGNPVKT